MEEMRVVVTMEEALAVVASNRWERKGRREGNPRPSPKLRKREAISTRFE